MFIYNSEKRTPWSIFLCLLSMIIVIIAFAIVIIFITFTKIKAFFKSLLGSAHSGTMDSSDCEDVKNDFMIIVFSFIFIVLSMFLLSLLNITNH